MYFKVSIIMPCYNSQNTLKRAIESIISQSIGFENIELIIYDDASEDKTKKIIDDYSKKYSNIIPLFSNYNNGPGFGRNLCISKANSDYIMFLDSDDQYNEKICENFLNEINDDIDCVSCNYERIDGESSSIIKERILHNHDFIYYETLPTWNKIFKREIIINNKIKFANIRNGEDELFLKQYYLHSKKITNINYTGCVYHKQRNSITNSVTLIDFYSFIELIQQIYLLFGDINVDMSELLRIRIKNTVESLYLTDILNDYDESELLKALDDLTNIENEMGFNGNLGLLCGICNFFIKRGYYSLVIFYSKTIYSLRKSSILTRIYRKIILN